ncbi:helix-turn-helix domain-containing protein [Nocardioides sp. MAH-18]|uniref:Helix-turn-helix domain-containing protein n=1 Tax=Nocardioides agri TaxID=2682843 RepID=A0A6L6Y228_9ACTN|nr:AraC family transcriptional regulator [Nocardioides sp. CGMCC 1.13656]MBA2952493.1 AraC family transcriptional regulator [Nocardioides sp. CGMCC 1.13656]MVQ51655.1 helix-turn-helix domain-containing protein [Nocardioides sp. MAH-18]
MDRDVLSETLADFGMTGVFYAASDLSAPWGIAIPPLPGTVVFHLVTAGELVLQVDGETTRMGAGDIVLVPHGTGHDIVDAPGSRTVPLFDLPRAEVGDRYERLRIDGGGARTELVCGAVSFTGLGVARLLRSLPPVLPAVRADDLTWMRAAFEVIGAESQHPRPGSDVVTARLADILVVQAVRSWLETATPGDGWVAGLRDPQLGRALAAFHAEPGAPWTLESLAAQAGMSRSAFAARFRDLLGEPPMSYATAWRMDLAARLVRERELPLARVAERVGYQSEAAFNRAFRRAHGMAPGAFARHDHSLLEHVTTHEAGHR